MRLILRDISSRPRRHALLLLCVTTSLACDGGPEGNPATGNAAFESLVQPLICGNDDRQIVVKSSPVPYPYGAIGWVSSGCSAVVISPTKIMSAAHCYPDSVAPSSLTFYPQANLFGFESRSGETGVLRIVRGRDEVDTEQYADWAILTLDTSLETLLGSNFQTMQRVIPDANPSIATIGYPGDFPGWLVELWGGTLTVGLDNNLYHNLDSEGGQSGSPLFRMDGASAALFGIASGHGWASPCVGTDGNTGANGRYFSFAPDNGGGIAANYTGNGRMTVYASDKDWTLVAVRNKLTTDASSNFTEWQAHDAAFPGGARKVAATNLQDNRQQVWVVNASGQLKTRWQTSVDGPWTAWSTQSTPTNVKDVAASGVSGVQTHLFILGTDNVVRYARKTSSGANFGAWTNLGTMPSGLAISAAYLPSTGSHHVFAVNSSGAKVAWGGGGTFNTLQSFGTSTGGFRAVGSGLLQDGRLSVMAVNGANALLKKTRSAAGVWSAWTAMPQPNPPNTSGFVVLSMGRLSDGREQVFGIASNGEIYSIYEVSANSFTANWARFYK